MHVLFVCHANMCRSALAEAIGRKLASERALPEPVVFRSAGLEAVNGLGASSHAIAVATEFGADLGAHRATHLTLDVADWSDYLIAMTRAQKADVRMRLPMIGPRTYTLAEYFREATGRRAPFRDVKDPVGGTIEDFRKCARLLYETLTDILDAMDGSTRCRDNWLDRLFSRQDRSSL